MALTGGLSATPESFFPTLPSLSLLVEDAAEGFSNLFARSSPDMLGAGEVEDGKTGVCSTSLQRASMDDSQTASESKSVEGVRHACGTGGMCAAAGGASVYAAYGIGRLCQK